MAAQGSLRSVKNVWFLAGSPSNPTLSFRQRGTNFIPGYSVKLRCRLTAILQTKTSPICNLNRYRSNRVALLSRSPRKIVAHRKIRNLGCFVIRSFTKIIASARKTYSCVSVSKNITLRQPNTSTNVFRCRRHCRGKKSYWQRKRHFSGNVDRIMEIELWGP